MTPLKPHGDPSHRPAADPVAERMFPMSVVQCIKDREGHFRLTHVAGGGLLLPKPIPNTEIEQVVTADVVRWDCYTGGGDIGQERKGLCERIGCCPDIVVTDLPTEAVFPLGPQACADF